MKTSTAFQTTATIVLTGFILWYAQSVLIPLSYAVLTAIVIFPACKYLESKKFGKILSILLPLLGVSILFAGLIALLSYEVIILSGQWRSIQNELYTGIDTLHQQLEREFGWTMENQKEWLKDNFKASGSNLGQYLSNTLGTVSKTLFNVFIIPIYIALILSYRRRLVRFVIGISPEQYRSKMAMVISETVIVFSRFITSMALVYLTVGSLNTLGLWIIGVKNPLFYGMLTAIMTIIPYFGIIISALIPITITWLETGSLWKPVGIVAVFSFVQYLEAYLIYPYVVGRFVNLNTFAAIVAVLGGALIWGVSGMILVIPFLAIFNLAASHFPNLKHWNDLLGN